MEKKPETDRLAALKVKQEQLKAQISRLEAQAKEKQRKEDTRRKIIVGAAVLEHASQHPAFAEQLRAVLQVAVSRQIDRQLLQDWLGE